MQVHERFKTPICISGLVTGIAAYHYWRIFNSWNEAYQFSPDHNASAHWAAWAWPAPLDSSCLVTRLGRPPASVKAMPTAHRVPCRTGLSTTRTGTWTGS